MNISVSQIIQIAVIVLAFVLPAVINAMKYLKKQREQQAREHTKQRALQEALRTGRDPSDVLRDMGLVIPTPAEGQMNPSPVTETQQRKVDMEARRKAQLEELRRRAQARRQGASGPVVILDGGVASPPQAPPQRMPGVPHRRPPTPAPSFPQRTPHARPQPVAQRPPQTQRPTHTQRAPSRIRVMDRMPTSPADSRRRQQQRPPKTPMFEPEPAHEVTHRLVSEAATSTRTQIAPSVMAKDLIGKSPQDWRRAIVMREILDQPVSLRPQLGGF